MNLPLKPHHPAVHSPNWNDVLDELERRAFAIADDRERAAKLYELARLAEEIEPRISRALELFVAAWRAAPHDHRPLLRARTIARDLGCAAQLARVGELELVALADDEQAGALAGSIGEALLDCGRVERARELLEYAIDRGYDTERVRDAMAALDDDPDSWADRVEMLSMRAASAPSATAARMLLRAARVVAISGSDERDERLCEQLLVRLLNIAPHCDSGN
ncbi:MAG: hypothetical protein AAGC55_23675, partial [Myxococcota bacterium]